MKKAIALLLALAICAALCACGNRQKTLEEADLSMTVNGVEVTTKSSVDTLLTIFDGKYETAEAVSCVYSGMERTYSNETLSVFTYPGDDGARASDGSLCAGERTDCARHYHRQQPQGCGGRLRLGLYQKRQCRVL